MQPLGLWRPSGIGRTPLREKLNLDIERCQGLSRTAAGVMNASGGIRRRRTCPGPTYEGASASLISETGVEAASPRRSVTTSASSTLTQYRWSSTSQTAARSHSRPAPNYLSSALVTRSALPPTPKSDSEPSARTPLAERDRHGEYPRPAAAPMRKVTTSRVLDTDR